MPINATVKSYKLSAVLAAGLVGVVCTASPALADDTKLTVQGSEAVPSLQIATGINWLSLPSWGARPDSIGSAGDSRIVDDGLNLGIILDLPLGQIGSQPFVMEWNGSIASLSSSSTDRTSLAGQSSLNMSVGSAVGTINTLSATPVGTLPAASEAEVWGPSGPGGPGYIFTRAESTSAADGRITQFASSPSITGSVFTALVTNGTIPSATALAGYGDNAGITFSAVGDLSSSAIVEDRNEDATVIDQTLLFGAPIDFQGGWTITPKFGPMYRSIDRDVDFRKTLRIGASVPGVTVPEVGIAQQDQLDSRYIGAMAELTMRKELQPDLSLSFDARLGGAYLHSRYRSQLSAILPTMTTSPFDFVSETRDDASLLAGAGAGLRYAPKENLLVGLDAGLDFINKTPTIDYVTDAGGVTPRIGMSHAINYNSLSA